MKYFFMITTMLAIACFFLSETKGEMFASGAAISLGIALFSLPSQRINNAIEKQGHLKSGTQTCFIG